MWVHLWKNKSTPTFHACLIQDETNEICPLGIGTATLRMTNLKVKNNRPNETENDGRFAIDHIGRVDIYKLDLYERERRITTERRKINEVQQNGEIERQFNYCLR